MSWSSEYDPRSFCALRLSVSARGPLGCCSILLSGHQTVPVDFKAGCRLKRSSSSSHMCSMGDRSGDTNGHFRCWMLTLARCCVTNLATCGLALSCCNSVPGPFAVTNTVAPSGGQQPIGPSPISSTCLAPRRGSAHLGHTPGNGLDWPAKRHARPRC